jgi:glycosyltransferase involved in cell wall biosynthesis
LDEGSAYRASSRGRPVIARSGALPEVVGDAGLMIEPEDPESIAAAMERMIGDAALRSTCALRGLERAQKFTWAQAARDTRRAYEAALVARLHRAPAMAGPSNIQTRDAHRR